MLDWLRSLSRRKTLMLTAVEPAALVRNRELMEFLREQEPICWHGASRKA